MVFVTILPGMLPNALMVARGGVVRNRPSVTAWQGGLDRFDFEILFPAFLSVAASPRPIAPVDIARIGPMVRAILLAGRLIDWGARRFAPGRFLDFAGAWLTTWRFNTAIGLVALGTLSHGNPGILSVAKLLAVMAPTSVLVLFAALPTASAAHVLASAFGANRELVATLIALSTLLGVATHPLWILAVELAI